MSVAEAVSRYAMTLTRILGEPRRFFRDDWQGGDLMGSIGFLLVCCIFNAGAGLTRTFPPQPAVTMAILFLNALGMACLTAVIAFTVSTLFFGRRAAFRQIAGITSLCFGVTLLASWIPFFIWMTEPWKWWLIAVGLVHGCRFKWWQAIVICGVTLLILIAFFSGFIPLMTG